MTTISTSKISPQLCFEGSAETAARCDTAVLPNSSFGCLNDKFDLSSHIVARRLIELIADPVPARRYGPSP